jgi:type IV secretory pathway ATPase VirB11/archaellum biosynthesis ATPase
VKWGDLVPLAIQVKYLEFGSIAVTTSNTLINGYFINICLEGDAPVLLCGPAGTGKTTVVRRMSE